MRLTEPICVAATDADDIVPDVSAVTQSSLTMTPLGELRYGRVPTAELADWLQACCEVGLRSELQTPRIAGLGGDGLGHSLTRMEFLVVRDLDVASLSEKENLHGEDPRVSEGRIVAYAEFTYHPAEQVSTQQEDSKPSGEASGSEWKSLQPPAWVHRELYEHWNNTVEAALRKQFGGLHCFEVRGLSTLSPSYLRKGIASKLLSWILPWADRLNVPVVLAATPPGYPLYLKHGFVPVGANRGAIECDMEDWGGSGIHRHILMVKRPEKKAAGELKQ